ncbi:hypothetical protein Q3G72_015024 [Acer saccharum]|nr:hypothetical protein Q3G72_015024 [Acer saccharum]
MDKEKPTKEDSLKKLEYFSLVSKVCSEMETHLGFGDKVLAEFITELGRNCETVEQFDAQLKENGAEMLDYFVRTLLTIIHAILPPKPKLDKEIGGGGNADEIEAEVRNRRERHGDRQERNRRRHDDGVDEENVDERVNGGEDRDRRNGQYKFNNEPELYQVYKGRVSRVMDTGCFVQLNDLKGKEGLVHVSQMATRRISNAKDVVKRDQEVYVKVISVSGQKLSLSMSDVDQNTGKDLLPLKKSSEDDAFRTNPAGSKDGPVARTGLSGIRIVEEGDGAPSRRPLKRMSSPERWEAKQLIACGVLTVNEYPMYDEEGDGMMYQEEGAEEELEIEMNEDEPAFLQGQNRYSVDMSPVKIFKNPEGSLSRAAALQSALIKERREVREQQQRTMLDSIPKDLNRPWEDPMPETGERPHPSCARA